MAIDKIIPRFLVSDEDERLLKEGAMTDALNVTISEDGDGTEGVIKNVKGTTQGTAVSGSELPVDAVTVIGQVSDPQRGFIYFFVADDSATGDFSNGTEHAIYQYNTSNNTYRLVIKRSWLKFDPNGFVKADVLNADFQQNGVVQTVIYFTDDVNAPRKINIDRALDGDYNVVSDSDLDYALLSIKAAPTSPPTFKFETDYNVEQNNFQENIFQYASQIIYKDGEESAISSYSKLAVSQSSIFGGLESEDYGVQSYVQNVCTIRSNINKNLADLDRVRLLARRGNDGSWFVVEEFDPKTSITREVIGTQVTVYNAGTQEYKFYNDRLGSAVDTNTVNKIYDNVPLKARGQAIVSNRLMYSDYTEGFENVSTEADVDLTVLYSNVANGNASLIDPADYTNVISQNATAPNIDIDLIGGNAFGVGATGSTIVPAGTRIYLSFVFDPTFTITGSGSPAANIISFNVKNYDSGVYVSGGAATATTATFSTLLTTSETLTVETFLSTDKSLNNVADLLATLVDDQEVTLRYDNVTVALTGAASSISGDVDITFKFGEVTSATNAAWTLKPRVTKISFVEGSFSIDSGGSAESIPDDDGSVYDCYARGGNLQSEVVYSSVNADYLDSEVAIAETLGASPTFKSGASYSLGVVYYDKWNRNGFVNELGNVFIDHIATRSSNYGPAAIQIDFDDYDSHPSWAESYQIVCTESSVQSVFQYTVGGAYATRLESSGDNPRLLNENTKKIYVSLKTLDLYKKDKDFLRDYSYTEGDKLRIISRKSDDNLSTVYPKASDGTVIEFDVVGCEKLINNAVNPIHINGSQSHSNDDSTNDPHTGTFLIIEAPAVAAQVDGTDGNPLEYVGYDWFQITGTDYSATNTVAAASNYWNRETLIEVVTPRKSTSEKVYYEIGERRKIGNYKDVTVGDHGPAFTINSGDVHYRAIAARTPVFNTALNPSAWNDMLFDSQQSNDENPETWAYVAKYIEDQSVSDAFSSKSWDKGRAHVVYKKAAEIRRRNGITYSDAYAEDVSNLSLSSFNTSLGNFETLESRYGAVEYIGNYNDDLVALQENKLCLIPVNKNILEYTSGSANVAVSTKVLEQRRYSAGDYGSGGHPEAVLIQDNSVYFVDESRQAVCSLTGGQLVPISDKGMSSFFEDFFATGATKYVSGYDPRDNTYYITRRGTNEDTVGYDAARGVWQSRYSFIPDAYANQNNMLYSFKYVDLSPVDLRSIIHKHSSSTRNSFYTTSYPSTVTVYSKMSPSRVKVFNAISYEGSNPGWDMSPGMSTDLDQTSGAITVWQEREGSYYAEVPRDVSGNGTSEEIYIGTLTSISGSTYSSNARLNRLPIVTGVSLTVGTTSGITVESFTSNTITFSGTDSDALAGTNVKIIYNRAVNGDKMRGHWAKITLTNSASSKHELYCINTHITDSKFHHPLGQ